MTDVTDATDSAVTTDWAAGGAPLDRPGSTAARPG